MSFIGCAKILRNLVPPHRTAAFRCVRAGDAELAARVGLNGLIGAAARAIEVNGSAGCSIANRNAAASPELRAWSPVLLRMSGRQRKQHRRAKQRTAKHDFSAAFHVPSTPTFCPGTKSYLIHISRREPCRIGGSGAVWNLYRWKRGASVRRNRTPLTAASAAATAAKVSARENPVLATGLGATSRSGRAGLQASV